MVEKTCGTCRLWAPNFYERVQPNMRGTTCCADAAMDLPASFQPDRQTMAAHEGAGCICWEALQTIKAQGNG